MARIHWISVAFFGAAALAEAKAVANKGLVLAKSMAESLNEIAAPYLDKTEIDAIVTLTAPKDQLIAQIDAMQKEIMKECNQEQATFDSWLTGKQSELYSNQQQIDSLVARETQLQQTVDQLQGQITGSQQTQNDLQTKLAQAQATKDGFSKQLQDAIDLRTKMSNQNLALIQQHKDALQALSSLRALVAKLNTDSDAVMDKLADVSFLHKSAKQVDALIETVKAELARAKSRDPQVKAQLKVKLLGLIDQIAAGVQESLDLYQNQETVQQQKFDNEIKPALLQMIAQAQSGIDSIQAQIGQVLGNIGSMSTQLKQAQADLAQATNQVQTLRALITSLQSQIQSGQDSHAQKQTRCKADLDGLEVVRQFIVKNISGMTPGNNCNPNSPNCARCLYNEQCPDGQICSDSGSCGLQPTTAPPRRPYYQLLPASPPTGWQLARRVDVNIVPQSAFQLNDFTYIFKYQQLQAAGGWSNLFNVLNTGENFPFPNQAALFLSGNMFEIDVCQDGVTWPASYWYRNFYLEKVELNTWTALAFIVSGSSKSVTLTFRDGSGKVRSQSYPYFHGRPSKFTTTGAWVNGRGYNSLIANFADFRRYDQALSNDDVLAVFKEFFP